MIRYHIWEKDVDEYWRERSLTDDEFYFGLGDRIKARQDSKIPVAGAGTVQFLDKSGGLLRIIGLFFPPARKVATLVQYAKEEARKQSGIHMT